MMLFIAAAMYAMYLAFTIRQMRQTGNRRHAWAWIALFGVGLAVQALYEMGFHVPGPAEPITEFISGLVPLG